MNIRNRTFVLAAVAVALMTSATGFAQRGRYLMLTTRSVSTLYDVARVDESGLNLVTLANGPSEEVFCDVSPDGTTVLYYSNATGQYQLYTMNWDGSNKTRITFTGIDRDARFSPDGTKIVYSHSTAGEWYDLFVANADASNSVNITNSPGVQEAGADWNRATNRIVCSRGTPNGGINLYSMTPNGTGLQQLTADGWDEWFPAWSIDGNWVAYHGLQGGNWEIMVVDKNGGNQRNVTNFPATADAAPTFNPENQIYFNRYLDVYRTNLDGSTAQQVTHLGNVVTERFVFGPDLGWSQWSGNGHWYRVVSVPQGLSWKEADVIARQQGGYLSTPTSAAENDFAFSLVNDPKYSVTDPTNGNKYGPWLGLVQQPGSQEPSGGWGWVTSEAFNFTNWLPGEPNNDGGHEDVGCYMQKPNQTGPFWNDIFDGTNPRNSPQLVSLLIESPYPPSAWQKWPVNGHSYKAVSCPLGIRWTDAQAQAAMEGGYLATPTSNSENDFVYSLLNSDRYRIPEFVNSTFISGWLGLWQPENAPEPAGGWLWSSLETSTYRNWTPGEPNNYLDLEDFAHYRYPIGSSQTGWNDFPNSGFPQAYVPSFVIERDSDPVIANPDVTPVPTTMTLTRGLVAGGLLPGLYDVDQNYLQVKKGLVLNSLEAPINVTLGATSPWSRAVNGGLSLTLRVNSVSIGMTLEIYDWQTQSYQPIDQRPAPTVDTTLYYNLSNPSRFINDTTREIKVRLSLKPTGPVSQNDWRLFIDRVKISVTP